MTQPRCRFVASDQPRVLVGRHQDECDCEACGGCLPCPMDHCRVCGVTHTETTCGECVAEVRANIQELIDRCDELPDELETRGIGGDVISLLGPTANPEARGHLRASVAAGRLNPDAEGYVFRDKHGNELPDRTPLWVLGSWAMIYRDAFGHDEPTSATTVGSEAGYLLRNLTEASSEKWVPFEDFARDIRDSVNYLKNVLHDQERGEPANVSCFDCGGDLERRLTLQGFEDRWTCKKCRRPYTIAEYNIALRAKLEDEATKESA